MVEVCETEDEIKIIIKLINITSRQPSIVLLKRYIKFNCPPTFFEAYLTDDIDEDKSSCKLLKREARIILKKINCGIWEKIFDPPENKTAALERRKLMVDELQKKNVEIEKEAIKNFDAKRKKEIEKEIARESKLREKFETANEQTLEKELGVKPEDTKKIKKKADEEKKKKQRNFRSKFVEEKLDNDEKILEEKEEVLKKNISESTYLGSNISKEEASLLLLKAENQKQIRKNGNIKISFTKFDFKTPKRESQKSTQDEIMRQRTNSQQKKYEEPEEHKNKNNTSLNNLEKVD